jgi:4,5:9,10-diseco-3-hydroxy-5,9,17-trioxoandrosta-1(10),2-diene-4-oate hydrolase
MALKEAYLSVDQCAVHYWHDDTRSGHTLVFLHSEVGHAHSNWHAVLPQFAQYHRVAAPDLPGFGGSQPLTQPTYHHLIGWIDGFMNALAVEKAMLVGSSLGATLARLYAAAYPDRIRALVLVNGGSLPRISPTLRLLGRLPGAAALLAGAAAKSTVSRASLEQGVHVGSALTDDFIAAAEANSAGLSSMYQAAARSTPPKTPQPPMDTLILWGANDGWSPLSEGQALAGSFPRARLEPLAECGHFPQIEAADVFAFQVQQFIDSLDAPARDKLPGAGRLRSR